MAYVNGEWLDRDARQLRIEVVQELVDAYKALAVSGEVTNHDLANMEELLDELETLLRVHRAENDLLYFVYEYFSEDRNPGNPDNLIPAGQKLEDAADFHRVLCSLLDDITVGKMLSNVAWSVGRGHAKTAYLSNGYLCQKVAYRHKRYIVEVSETTDVAGDFIQWTRNQLVHNQKLRGDFGILLHERKSLNETDNKYEFITLAGTKVEAKGIGTQMRGLRHGSVRVELFLLDDLESRDNTNTPELREKNKKWFRTEMLPALSRDGMCIYMGTIVHFDSLLNYVVKERRDFVSRKFPAILEWSNREDLWSDWQRLYREDDPNARDNARQFYKKNIIEMTDGTRTLWPTRFSYLDLMEIKENDGAQAFSQEYLGNPIDSESQIFRPEEFAYYIDEDLRGLSLDYYCGIDFAMGKERGDYSAIVTIARNRETGVCYVVDVFLQRVHPDVLLKTAVEKALKYQYEYMAVEAQQAQEWFADKLGDALQANGYPSRVRLKHIKQRSRKALRIESLLPDVQVGRIRFKHEQRLLLEMFEMYPGHNHDDGPDALEMAISVTKERRIRLQQKPGFM